jgi:hypothetical protein
MVWTIPVANSFTTITDLKSVSSNRTRVKFVLDASGFGVDFFGPIFAGIYRRNLEK